jgi:hypothetical protein
MPDSYFAKVYFDQLHNEVYRCNTFRRGLKREDYLLYIGLPPLE